MISVTANVDTSTELNLVGISTGISFEFRLTKFENKAKTQTENFTGDYIMFVWVDEIKRNLYRTLTEGDGLIKTSNTLTIKRTTEGNDFEQGEYYYQIICDLDTDNSYIEYKGKIKVEVSR